MRSLAQKLHVNFPGNPWQLHVRIFMDRVETFKGLYRLNVALIAVFVTDWCCSFSCTRGSCSRSCPCCSRASWSKLKLSGVSHVLLGVTTVLNNKLEIWNLFFFFAALFSNEKQFSVTSVQQPLSENPMIDFPLQKKWYLQYFYIQCHKNLWMVWDEQWNASNASLPSCESVLWQNSSKKWWLAPSFCTGRKHQDLVRLWLCNTGEKKKDFEY